MSEKHTERLRTDLEKLANPQTSLEAPPIPPTGLLGLPLEIRVQIYHYCIPQNSIFGVTCWSPNDDYRNGNKNKTSLFRLSMQISEEALDILYDDIVLFLHERGEYRLKRYFTERNIRRMRSLVIVARPEGETYELGSTPDDALWSSILPQLRVLRIVVEQPVEDRWCFNLPTFQDEVNHWFRWIRPYLVCFSRHLSGQTVVEVDCDGMVGTENLVDECLGHGCQKVRCHRTGDWIFERGEFSVESGGSDYDGYNDRDYCDDYEIRL